MSSRALGRLLLAHPILGGGVALVIKSGLGAAPWDVFHVGLARATGLSIGTATNCTAAAAVLLALLVGVRPGLATLVNALVFGVCLDVGLALVPPPASLPAAAAYLAGGILVFGLGSGLYLSARLGSGPRDSLMLALAQRRRWSAGRARAVVELSALAAGLALGGHASIGTLVYAVSIGPVAQWSLSVFSGEPA